jgi:hypothetical protein
MPVSAIYEKRITGMEMVAGTKSVNSVVTGTWSILAEDKLESSAFSMTAALMISICVLAVQLEFLP